MPSYISCHNSSRGRKAGLWTQLTSCQYSGRRLWFLPYSPLSIPTLAPFPVSIIPRVCGDNRNSKLRLEEERETILSSESLAYWTLAARASIPQQRLQIFVVAKCMFRVANTEGFQLKTYLVSLSLPLSPTLLHHHLFPVHPASPNSPFQVQAPCSQCFNRPVSEHFTLRLMFCPTINSLRGTQSVVTCQYRQSIECRHACTQSLSVSSSLWLWRWVCRGRVGPASSPRLGSTACWWSWCH